MHRVQYLTPRFVALFNELPDLLDKDPVCRLRYW
jgi:hypothetical protein